MNSRVPRTQEIYKEVLNTLYNSNEPMSIEAIKTMVSDEASGVTNLTSKLLNQLNGYSPIKRLGYNSYTLTDWARKDMDAGKLPTDPRYMSTELFTKELTPEKSHKIVDSMIKILLSDTKELQNQSEEEEVLQHVLANNYSEIKDISPISLLPLLNEAIIKADEISRGTIFSWKNSNEFTLINGYHAKTESIWLSSDIHKLSPFELLEIIVTVDQNLISHQVMPRNSEHLSQALFEYSDKTVRVYVSESGETIKEHQIISLLREKNPREKIRIYTAGQVLPRAIELANNEDIEIVLSDQTKKILSDYRMFGDLF